MNRSWSIWWDRLFCSPHAVTSVRSSRLLDAFELEERILLSATPAPDPSAATTSTSTASQTTSTTTPSSSTSGTSATSTSSGVNVVLIDIRLPDSGALAQAVQSDAQLFLYDSTYDSAHDVLTRVAEWAETTGTKIESLSILGQGANGEFELGSDWISSSTLQQTAADWQRLGQSLAAGASIDLFGSFVASQNGDGQSLLDQIAQLTGADVFASTNLTGQGGDWLLEASSSNVPTGATSYQVDPFDDLRLGAYLGTLTSGVSSIASDSSQNLVFVDSSIDNVQTLIRDIPSNMEIVLIDSARDGIDQIAQALQGRQGVNSISILSHGSDANIFLGTSDLNLASLGTLYAADFAAIRNALSSNAEILIYGCDVAELADGQSLINAIASATGANVAASINLTGAAALGGDWTLEYSTGPIVDYGLSSALAESQWNELLQTVTFTQGVNSYSGATDTYIDSGATGANNGSASTINA
ncbi:MAG: DUF4347 domain-containing protein, partial [Candidatus Pacebacteria bacterium]|nr:DUF4347 domain-containing protein [Candidatus Paceibacterota bacterium]